MTNQPSFSYGGVEVAYRLTQSRRQTLEISVYPDGSVVVKAPLKATPADVARRVQRRARWVLRQLAYFKQWPSREAPIYASGATHYYLGKPYRLSIVAGDQTAVALRHGQLHVISAKPHSARAVKMALDAWYRRQAQREFAASLARAWPRLAAWGLPAPRLCIRRMQKRWGSMSARGRLTLNLRLIEAPLACIDYVVCHELCHLKHRHHGAAFYQALDDVLADWPQRKRQLEQGGA